MSEPLWVRAYRIAFGLLALASVARSFWTDEGTVANFLSKFTYQTNTYSALVLLGGAFLAPTLIRSFRWDLARGAAVMYAITTFLVYGFLVNGFTNPFDGSVPWTNTVEHQLMPAVLAADLLIRPLAHRIPWRSTLVWTIYPIAFVAYSLIRGAITGWYPYDFLDPDQAGGYGAVALYTVAITVGFLAIGSLIGWVSHRRHRPVAIPAEHRAAVEPALPR